MCEQERCSDQSPAVCPALAVTGVFSLSASVPLLAWGSSKMALHSKTRESGLAACWCLQPQNERCQLIKSHMSSGGITGGHFQSGIFGTKVWYFL